MIQVLDQNDREIYKYRLLQGENRFGSDPKQCKYLIRNVQGVLFSVALLNNDVYFTHFSNTDQVLKESTLKQDQKVEIPKNFIIEMVPLRNYYFQNFKFKLLNSIETIQQNIQCTLQTTQILEDFSGTMALDDILDIPQQVAPKVQTTQQISTTQVLSSQDPVVTSTLILDEVDQSTLSSLNELISQYSGINSMVKSNHLSTNDAQTQTEIIEAEPQLQKTRTLFSDLFKTKRQTSQISQQIYQHPQQPTLIDQTMIDSQMQSIDQNQNHDSQFVNKKAEIKGTMIDDDLNKAFSSSQNKSVDKLEQSQIKRFNSIQSDNVQITQSKQENNNSKIELNDLFGSLPEMPNQQIQQQQTIKKFPQPKSNILNTRYDDSQDDKNNQQQDQTPIKVKNQKLKQTSSIEKQGKKQTKGDLKKVALLKKITDEISDETSEESNQSKQQIRHTNSIELPATKIFQQNDSKNNKKLGNKKNQQKKVKNVQLIAFSGFQPNEIPQANDLKKLGLEIVNNQLEKFDLLVLNNPPKRTFKFLSALLLGAEIVTLDWLTNSLKQGKAIQKFHDYVPNSDEFQNSFGLSIEQIVQSRDTYFETNKNLVKIFDGKYHVKADVTPSKAEIEYLIKLGGGEVLQKPGRNVITICDTKVGNSMPSDFILDGCMFQS
ncbi:unnamed protein product (macronuclear) [Paramecium tetraurelia]|uniref:BRCT domain-containing protein n=1 Tax=Paramecium tetraurelia TaxID=5888 RepID=A0CST2_PARTE|nr:uncharacterized protein GSPATT00010121001 [Paramecium tetraurelia]CAK73849.1 unnamed protein product [Paramecium tetraurelia]|eukprot:XP_001441246.1 hypothetical protein (macronuclear) [Paramecium tetraurelia strain d4-2]